MLKLEAAEKEREDEEEENACGFFLLIKGGKANIYTTGKRETN